MKNSPYTTSEVAPFTIYLCTFSNDVVIILQGMQFYSYYILPRIMQNQFFQNSYKWLSYLIWNVYVRISLIGSASLILQISVPGTFSWFHIVLVHRILALLFYCPSSVHTQFASDLVKTLGYRWGINIADLAIFLLSTYISFCWTLHLQLSQRIY